MAKFTEDEAAELFKRVGATSKALREPRECGREGCETVFTPTGPRGKYCCDKCRELVKAEQNKAYKERDPEYHKTKTLAKAPSDYGDPFSGVANECPDCGAMYDATSTCSGDKNRRQFTRVEKGIDYDYFVCFCGDKGHTMTRYK